MGSFRGYQEGELLVGARIEMYRRLARTCLQLAADETRRNPARSSEIWARGFMT
jgi:hypothetical protein